MPRSYCLGVKEQKIMLPASGVIRAFISIELPDETKRKLSEVGHVLGGKKYEFVRWARPESLHLTLRFLGNISAVQVEEVTAIIKDAARGYSPFHLEFREPGAFPDLKQPRIVWVSVAGEVEKLSSLQQKIDSSLAFPGLAREDRSFVPHLTLARLREGTSYKERKEFGARVAGAGIEIDCPLNVTTVSLMKSQLTPQGAVYTCLAAVGLRK
jgi:2'-5' RNA ligase